MTEIEKMFENAGIKKCNRMLPCPFKNECKDCEFNWFPDFIAEKQQELIKWLAKIYELSINWDEQYNSYRFVVRNYKNGRLNHSVCGYEIPFEETLAYLINRIWQVLTNKEKEEIRGILNE